MKTRLRSRQTSSPETPSRDDGTPKGTDGTPKGTDGTSNPAGPTSATARPSARRGGSKPGGHTRVLNEVPPPEIDFEV